jgi:hypothetical protein
VKGQRLKIKGQRRKTEKNKGQKESSRIFDKAAFYGTKPKG